MVKGIRNLGSTLSISTTCPITWVHHDLFSCWWIFNSSGYLFQFLRVDAKNDIKIDILKASLNIP